MERRNDLTVFLRNRAANASSEWNVLAKPVREWILASVGPLLQPLSAANPAVGGVLDSVWWDLHSYLMTAAYARHRPPQFFDSIFRVYDAGRFPCGWRGEYPDGELLVL